MICCWLHLVGMGLGVVILGVFSGFGLGWFRFGMVRGVLGFVATGFWFWLVTFGVVLGVGSGLVLMVVGLWVTCCWVVVTCGSGFVVWLCLVSGWLVVVAAGCVVVDSMSSCLVRFSICLSLVTLSSFPVFMSCPPLNISWISFLILEFSGFLWCRLVCRFGGWHVLGSGLGGFGFGAGSEAAAAAPTLGSLGWGRSWRPIFGIVPFWRRVASPPPS